MINIIFLKLLMHIKQQHKIKILYIIVKAVKVQNKIL